MDFFYIFTLLDCFSRASAIVVVRFILHSELTRKMISVGCIYTCIANCWMGLGSIGYGDLVSFENFNYLSALVSTLRFDQVAAMVLMILLEGFDYHIDMNW